MLGETLGFQTRLLLCNIDMTRTSMCQKPLVNQSIPAWQSYLMTLHPSHKLDHWKRTVLHKSCVYMMFNSESIRHHLNASWKGDVHTLATQRLQL